MHGLYALTPDGRDDDTLLAQVAAAHVGGARLLQYRNKSADAAQRQRQAARLARFCRDNDMRLIINDDVALAAAVGAHGVHLGGADASVAAARRQLGSGAIIGSTCKNSIPRARAAAEAGADYVAFGAMYDSPSKPAAARCPVEVLREAKRDLALPLVAIGGITPANAPALLRAGADAIAVIQALFSAPAAAPADLAAITAAARAFCRLFEPPV